MMFNRKTNLILFLVAFCLCFLLTINLPSALASTAKHYTDLVFPPLPALQLPKYTRFQLKNGLIVYLMEDHELPLVSGTALIRTGGRWEPGEKVGLADITGDVMRMGGTLKYPPDELNKLLENRAASVETSIDLSAGSASFGCLTPNLDTVFNLFAEVLRSPAFPQDKLDLMKQQLKGSIARRNDSPNSIVGREFSKLIYGQESPYARTIEYTTLDNISRADMVALYQQYFHPENIILGISGDFDSAKMRSNIEAKFGDWQPNPNQKLPPLPPVSPANSGGIFAVDLPQLTQSNVQIGHLGGMLNSPDYIPLSVMNQVLNGFGGRLFNNIRSRQGLAYSVYAAWSPRYDYPGIFIAGGQTRSETTVQFIKSIRQEIENLRTTKVAPEELNFAKESTLNSFLFKFEDPSQTLARLLQYEYYNYPQDFIFTYRQGVEKTTVEDIQRVAQKYLKPEEMVTLVVGNLKDIKPSLTTLAPDGKIKKIEVK